MKVFFYRSAYRKEKLCCSEYSRTVLNQLGFVGRCSALFFLAFSFARLFKIARIKPYPCLIEISLLERVMENIPGIKRLNSTLVAVGMVHKQD